MINPAYTNGLLAGGAVLAGWWGWGWHGLLLALSVIVFWMLMQFTRAVRTLRHAGQRPIGHVDSATLLQARLSHGMSVHEVIALTGSLGTKVGAADDWQWRDPAGNEVVVHFRRGRVVRWSVARVPEDADAQAPAAAAEAAPAPPEPPPAHPAEPPAADKP
jgi:hypothetical protein